MQRELEVAIEEGVWLRIYLVRDGRENKLEMNVPKSTPISTSLSEDRPSFEC